MNDDAPHVHDCTGPNLTCPCGYTFHTPRYFVEIEVFDNVTKKALLQDIFSTDDITAVEYAFDEALKQLGDLPGE